MKLVTIFLLCSLTATFANCQTFGDILNPNKETIRNARINVQTYLNQVQDTLEIFPKRQAKVKRLKLTPCEKIYSALENNELFGDATEFIETNNCEGLYRYQHPISNPQRTHYLLTFYFDATGDILSANSQWILIIR
jgi:hypothetical protein